MMAIHPETGDWFDETVMHCTECGAEVEDQDEPGGRFTGVVSDPEHGEVPIVELLCKRCEQAFYDSGGTLRAGGA